MNPTPPIPRNPTSRTARIRRRLQSVAVAALTVAAGSPGAFGQALTPSGFAIPQPDPEFRFPRDHGSHPAFQIEWWYVTGHLQDDTGRDFGYQATFFRRAGPTPDGRTTGGLFDSAPVFLAHMALTDVDGRTFRFQERLNRAGWDARASDRTLDVSNGNWSLRREPGDTDRFVLRGGVRAEAAFELVLEPAKPMVVFGRRGVSRKAADPSAASHYLTFTRLRTTGTLTRDGVAVPVTGESWMDHEYSSSQLGADQVGWDWASLQLADGREVMVYRMRRADGSTDPYSTLAWIGRDGTLTQSGPEAFRWEEGTPWTSPRTGGRYPVRPRIHVTDSEDGRAVVFRLEPRLEAQEIDGALGGVPYWEGACRVLGADGREIGRAYLELTGHVRPVTGIGRQDRPATGSLSP